MYAAPCQFPAEEPPRIPLMSREIRGDVVGEQMRSQTCVYAGMSPGADRSRPRGRGEGPSAIKKGDLISEETALRLRALRRACQAAPGQ